ncbi:MAG: D-alanyl-D-alanine carboxypeptidase [Agathobacter sp.]|nr:D-alanyl-D-alanine carboxypeptidase [Agathobacter sp.]
MAILLCIILIVGTIFGSVGEIYRAEENLSMYSGSYALIDGNTARVLKGKEDGVPMANASTTKILTCIVALENGNLEDLVIVSANAAAQPKVHLGMREGEQYPLKDLLYGLMLESYNDCAVAIAEHIAGNTEAFAKMMNDKAVEMGCKDTYFITPNGLDAEDDKGFHHTTASDLCRIMAYCTWESPMKDLFLEITQTRNYTGASNGKDYSFVNRNAFLNQMDGVLSGKTGFTNKAGYCYVAAMEVNGERYCIALLACGWPNNKNYKWKDARTLFEYGMENYDLKNVTVPAVEQQITIEGYVLKTRFQALNQRGILNLGTEEKAYQLLMSEGEQIETEIILDTDTKLPVQQGQTMGMCNVYLNTLLLDSFPIVAKDNAYIWGWKDVFCTIFYQFLTFSL